MLYWSFVFLIVALVAAVFGFSGIAPGAAAIAKVLFVLYLALALVCSAAHAINRDRHLD